MHQLFTERLRSRQAEKRSVVCVGLDPDPALLPPHLTTHATIAEATLAFNAAIIDATHAAVCAFKINLAFYEVLGSEGWRVLSETRRMIPDGVLVIADAKRGDIGNSARFYAEALFSHLDADACTVAPYMGRDAVTPFLQFPRKAAFVLGRTSNPGAADFQERTYDGEKLYLGVAKKVAEWAAGTPGEGGLVVGATGESALADIRRACPQLPFLVPGVGAQGGDARAVMRAARTDEGAVIVNSSRKILFASGGRDFAEAAAREVESLRILLERACAD